MEAVIEEKKLSRKDQRKILKEKKKKAKSLMEQYHPMTRKEKCKNLLREIWAHRVFYIMLVPSFILLLIFAYKPMYAIVLAFKKYSPRLGILGSKWVGFQNFETLFAMEGFWAAFKNTIVLNLLKLVFGFPASILLALMINAIHNKFFKL